MTRYEKFMQSINTPEKLIGISHHESWVNEALDNESCPYNFKCGDCDTNINDCDRCFLQYLNEEID